MNPGSWVSQPVFSVARFVNWTIDRFWVRCLNDGDTEFFHNRMPMFQSHGTHNSILKTNTGFRFDRLKDTFADVSLRYDRETNPAPRAMN